MIQFLEYQLSDGKSLIFVFKLCVLSSLYFLAEGEISYLQETWYFGPDPYLNRLYAALLKIKLSEDALQQKC